jgi:excisionase family DNA binding protein
MTGTSTIDRARLTVNVQEAGKLLGISRAAAYQAVSNGEIPSVRIGRRILIPERALAKLLDQHQTPRDSRSHESVVA